MAVRSFVTNYLVKEHDNYVEFMKHRTAEIKENGDENTYKLFYKYGLMGKATGKNSAEYASICKWHCIVLTYDIWYDVVKDYAIDGGSTSYKKFVDVPKNSLKTFRYRVNNAIKSAECDYNKRINHNGQRPYDACRYLAMFWTYLDCIKDTKTQRFLPSMTTIHRACEIFGYSNDENPFIMNGKYWNYKNEEDSAVEEKKLIDVTNHAENVLDANIRDMNFSVRTYNCLYRSKNETLGDILKMTPKELVHIRNLGRRSLNEIFNKVKEYGWQYDENNWTKLPTPIESESVIDIAEEAAQSELNYKASEAAEHYSEVLKSLMKKGPSPDDIPNEEETEIRPYPNEYNRLLNKYNILKESTDRLKEKYDDIFKHLEEMTDKYDVLLKEKLDLESYNSRLKDDANMLKDDLESATARIRGMSANREDMFVLLKSVLSKMEENKMNDLTMVIDGVVVDIHKQRPGVYKGVPVTTGTYAIRTRQEAQ